MAVKVHLHGKKTMAVANNILDFADIATCPICTQTKPVETFTVREFWHIVHHLRAYARDLIESTKTGTGT